jgi:murein L,D-transpeptidase YcbB/YkuD
MKTCLLIFFLMLAADLSKAQDRAFSKSLSEQLALDTKELKLNFPESVKRFYHQNGLQAVWIKPQNTLGKTWQAMLILDCVLQFGLAPADYHPSELSYEKLHQILENPGEIDTDVEARFEVLLTDAVISLMNNLHYGRLNPDYSASRLDRGTSIPMLAETKLQEALKVNDFMETILGVQPKNKLYSDLQEYMRLVKGQYAGDCYEIPEADIRLMAINMERLRWANIGDVPFLHVNIPSYTLYLQEPDSVYTFRVIVGSPERPTPSLQSSVSYFSTAPNWMVPSAIFIKELLPKALKRSTYFKTNGYVVYNKSGKVVDISPAKLQEIKKSSLSYSLVQTSGPGNAMGALVFRFPNRFNVFLHDTPNKHLFQKDFRALSHGCVRVQKATNLASLLLKYDGSSDQTALMLRSASDFSKVDFKLKKPVPLKITYITCTINNGLLERYKDIYHLDNDLEQRLYHIKPQGSSK